MTNHTNYYTDVLKAWQAKVWGSKPTAEMFATAHGLGCRPGLQALAVAMGLRPEGVTGSQIVGACGNPQLNKMRGLVSDALLRREAAARDQIGHQVYKLTLTAKGGKRVEATTKRAAELEAAGKVEAETKAVKKAGSKKAVKAARKVKVKAAVAAKADEPVPAAVEPTADNQPQA
jgi:hypothetical protein